jgi:hypothetical protein
MKRLEKWKNSGIGKCILNTYIILPTLDIMGIKPVFQKKNQIRAF